MSTKLIGQESGRVVEVSLGVTGVPLESGVHSAIIRDTGQQGSVEVFFSPFGVIFPIHPASQTERVVVSTANPHDRIWTGTEFSEVLFHL